MPDSVWVIGRDRGDDHGAALAAQLVGAGHHVAVHHAGRHDDLVGHLAPGHLHHGREGLLHRDERVGGAELHRLLALELDRVDGDDPPGAGHPGALHGVDADAADADDHDGVARLRAGALDGRAPPVATPQETRATSVQRQVVVDLDDRRLGDHGVLAERAELGHEVELVLAAEVAGRCRR